MANQTDKPFWQTDDTKKHPATVRREAGLMRLGSVWVPSVRVPGTPLPNPVYENFAQNVAAGMQYTEAYQQGAQAAGRKLNARPSQQGSKIRKHPFVLARISEIQAEVAAKIAEKRVEQSITTTKYSRDFVRGFVLDELFDTVKRCKQRVLADDGKGYTFNAKDANTALSLLGKEFGMFVDRTEIRQGDLDSMTAEELENKLLEEKEKLEKEMAQAALVLGDEFPATKLEMAPVSELESAQDAPELIQ